MTDQLDRMRAELERAKQAIGKWASFADPFYHRKHGLADDIAAIDRVLEETAPIAGQGLGEPILSTETGLPWPQSAGNEASGRVAAPHPSNTLSGGLRSASDQRAILEGKLAGRKAPPFDVADYAVPMLSPDWLEEQARITTAGDSLDAADTPRSPLLRARNNTPNG